MDAPDEIRALFPHAAQVARVVRTYWKGNGKTWTRVHRDQQRDRVPDHHLRKAGPEHIAAYARHH